MKANNPAESDICEGRNMGEPRDVHYIRNVRELTIVHEEEVRVVRVHVSFKCSRTSFSWVIEH